MDWAIINLSHIVIYAEKIMSMSRTFTRWLVNPVPTVSNANVSVMLVSNLTSMFNKIRQRSTIYVSGLFCDWSSWLHAR